MRLSSSDEYSIALSVIRATCKVGNVDYISLISTEKSSKLNALRGVCCFVAWEYGVHARKLSKLMHRDRSNILNTIRRYLDLYRVGDKLVKNYHKLIIEKLKENGEVPRP